MGVSYLFLVETSLWNSSFWLIKVMLYHACVKLMNIQFVTLKPINVSLRFICSTFRLDLVTTNCKITPLVYLWNHLFVLVARIRPFILWYGILILLQRYAAGSNWQRRVPWMRSKDFLKAWPCALVLVRDGHKHNYPLIVVFVTIFILFSGL